MRLNLRPRRGRPAARVQTITVTPVHGAAPKALHTEVVLGYSDGRAVCLELAGVDIQTIYQLQAAIIDAVRNAETGQMARAK